MIQIISVSAKKAKATTGTSNVKNYDVRLFQKTSKELITPTFSFTAKGWAKTGLIGKSAHIGVDKEAGKAYLIVTPENEGRFFKTPKEGATKKAKMFVYRDLSDSIAPNLPLGESIELHLNLTDAVVENSIAVYEISLIPTVLDTIDNSTVSEQVEEKELVSVGDEDEEEEEEEEELD